MPWPLTAHRVDVLLIGVGLVFIYLVTPFEIHGDGNARYLALSALLADRTIDGTTPYSLEGPLFSAPLWWFGSLWDQVAPRISMMVRPPADDVTAGGVSPATVG